MDNLEQSLITTLRDSDLSAISIDLADGLLGDALLTDIPVIGTLRKLFKSAGNISTYLFTKKLILFLCELKDVPPAKRQEQVARMTESEEYAGQVGESVMLLLDRIDDMRKPKMVGKAFKAYLLGTINLDELRQLNRAIDLMDVNNISFLTDLYAKCERYTDQHVLSFWGLGELALDADVMPDGSFSADVTSYAVRGRGNYLGRLFMKVILEMETGPIPWERH